MVRSSAISAAAALALAGCREKAAPLPAPAPAPATLTPPATPLRSEAELRKKGAQIVDLSHTRIVDLGDAVVFGLPGAFERRQLHSDGACIYAAKDIEALAGALERIPGPALLVASVPPRGQDAKALDVSEGQN